MSGHRRNRRARHRRHKARTKSAPWRAMAELMVANAARAIADRVDRDLIAQIEHGALSTRTLHRFRGGPLDGQMVAVRDRAPFHQIHVPPPPMPDYVDLSSCVGGGGMASAILVTYRRVRRCRDVEGAHGRYREDLPDEFWLEGTGPVAAAVLAERDAKIHERERQDLAGPGH